MYDWFRWVPYQLDVLEACNTLRELRKALNDLPKTLKDTYARVSNRVIAHKEPNVTRTLQFLGFPERMS